MTITSKDTIALYGISISSLVSGILSTAAVGLLLFWFTKRLSNNKRYPNGPWGFPILGHLPIIGNRPNIKFTEWAKTYGPVFRIQMGSRFTVVISGYKAIKEALVVQSHDFAARPDFYTFQLINGGKSMTFSRYGPQWKLHKTFARNALSLFTQKQVRHLEEHVIDEADTIISELMAEKESVDPKRSIHVATAAIVFSICFEEGQSIRENKDFLEVLSNTDEFGKVVGARSNPVDMMPWTLPFFKGHLKAFSALTKKFLATNSGIQERLRQTWTPHEPRNLTDALLDILNDTGDKTLEEQGLSRDHVLGIVGDVMGAGQGTIVSFLTWALLYLIHFPEVQRRAHEEIDRELGSAKAPSYDDRQRLPYCEAIFFETLRFSTSLPFLLPHATSQDCVFQGYDLPAGALVFFNMSSVAFDPELWENPREFEPMRFIDPTSGQIDRNKTEQVMMFGMGKRRCLGEFLGRLESFVFMVRLLQRCEFSKAENESYSLDGKMTLAMETVPYKLKLALRG